jgi:hypothetical protein
MNDDLKKYRDTLLVTMRFLNESYDKMLIMLSGGALGLSITFLKDVVNLAKVKHAELIMLSWLAFIISLAAVLGRVLFGIEAYRKAISQVDDGSIYNEKPGGIYACLTKCLHILSAASLLVGLLLIAIFSYLNVGG